MTRNRPLPPADASPATFAAGSLTRFPVETLTRFQVTAGATAAPAARSALREHQRHARRPTRRRTFDTRHIANVADALPGLPEPGESWHLVAKGNTPLFLMLPRILELAAPATITALRISTLGFSLSFAETLLSMLDGGQIGSVGLAASSYFRATSEREFSFLSDQLSARGQPIRVCRTHAKVIAALMSDGQGITLEGSGNLRSCRNCEQLVVTNDVDLTRFHQRWIDSLLAGDDAR